MKDLLNYYYYIITDRINMINHNYYFFYQNNYFCLYRYNSSLEDINSVFKLNSYMSYNNYKINKIILNKDNHILTIYQGNYYILVLLNINQKKLVDLQEIINFNNRILNLNILNRTNWLLLWSNKIDNIEYSIIHIMHKYKIIYNSIYYYIGLCENAISYLKFINIKNDNIGICHKRVLSTTTLIDFYNPLNLIIDYRIRDLAEYFKSCFFTKKLSILDIINNFKKIKMSNIDYIFFYIRMLFPSFYFDLYDQILNGKIQEEKILEITKYQDDYEYLLYEIYLVIKKQVNIMGIDWINKKFAI